MTLIDPGSIDKLEGAIQKLVDATTKLCAVREAASTSAQDKAVVTRALNSLAAQTEALSLLLPFIPPP